jgi:hypothetical protein
MHDCRKFKDGLLDLLFESEDANERSRLFREVNSCESCQNLYRSMSETLALFDQGTQTALPEEAYWAGYEERLRARLTEPKQQGLFAALFEKISLARIPLPLRAAIACLVVAAGLWLLFNKIEKPNPPAPVAVTGTAPDSEQKELADGNKQPESLVRKSAERKGPERKGPEQKPDQTTARNTQRASAPAAREVKTERRPEPVREAVAQERRAASADYLNLEVASHLEQAELLMRAFRNIKPSQDQTAFDISYEKQLSKELLAKNMLLRRSAESRRNLAVEDLLTGIEPLLLDIANLSDSPTQDDVRSIKDLIQRQEVVATLQFYSAKASSRSN